ncbi:hypothetical protein DAPPUDRAFT_247647 [Daphnia pulex]|uniref:Uncharacterized protein n=1 Tax=Daphnia pulex TaxID=6669 RepID=E9GSV8_DAPPU|nr:hypothetical protein DAPPUDRAFT_247647 [Daphnia pulex]|eukprot:EFX77498.1 hypothetical protein DAPPUDRAFT_247647 [Daphnia pulex]
MKLVWSILFSIPCNAEDIVDGRLVDIFGHPTTPFTTSLDGKHLRLIGTSDADMFPGAIIGTLSRFKDADFSTPWISSPFSILIPIPKSSTNIAALIDPMRTEVWICIGLSVPTVIATK